MPREAQAEIDVEAIPWSELGPTFLEVWGRPRGKAQPEHMEVTGQTGSGKGYFVATVLQQRAQVRGTSAIKVVTKPDDDTLPRLGWPIVDTWQEAFRYRWSIFWPRTTATGAEREKYLEERVYELLVHIWHPNANTIVAFDEERFLEELSDRLKKQIRMFYREGRAMGIPVVAEAQRPVGMVRDQHSETAWKVVFPPADEDDMERFAQLLGPPKLWTPVLEDLTQERHEFVIRHTLTKEAFVSWVDLELRPIPAQRDQKPTDRPPQYGRQTRRK